VVIDKERDVMPIANDPDRERRLWDATRELPNQALSVVRLRVLIDGVQEVPGADVGTDFTCHSCGFEQRPEGGCDFSCTCRFPRR